MHRPDPYGTPQPPLKDHRSRADKVPVSLRALIRAMIAGMLMSFTVLAPSANAGGVIQSPIALGVNLSDAPGSMLPLRRYAQMAGRRPALVMWYQQSSEPLFYPNQLPHVAAIGALPLITWDPSLRGQGISLRQIANGRYDRYIRATAAKAARWRRPIYIRFAHEMNLAGSPYGPTHLGDSPTEFRRAWRRVVRIFRAQHASNVEWVWSPNVDCGGKCPFAAYFPGPRWVDWVALDGYNYSSVDTDPWESFDRVFASSYRAITRLADKPVMIAETASASQGGSKADWITHAFRSLPLRFDRVRAVVWFDRVKETNWTVNSSRSSLRAWRRVVGSPEYAGSATTLLDVAPLESDVTHGMGLSGRHVARPEERRTPRTGEGAGASRRRTPRTQPG